MRRRWILGIACAGTVASLLPAGLAVADPSGGAPQTLGSAKRFTLSWKQNGALHQTDVDPVGLSSGDQLQATFVLTGSRKGSADFACTAVGQHYLCSGIVRLTDGDLYVQVGPLDESDPAAVVGGTRRYDGAKGEFTQKENEDGTGSWSFRLRR